MKIRDSLVSNSSSSSFVIIGTKCKPEHITKEDLKSKKIIVVGKYLCEGHDVFTLTKQGMLNFINRFPSEFKIFKNAIMVYEDCERQFKISDFGEPESKVTIYSGSADMHSCGSIEDLVDNYEELLAEDMQKCMVDQFQDSGDLDED